MNTDSMIWVGCRTFLVPLLLWCSASARFFFASLVVVAAEKYNVGMLCNMCMIVRLSFMTSQSTRYMHMYMIMHQTHLLSNFPTSVTSFCVETCRT